MNPGPGARPARENRIGGFWMIASMAGFAVEDAGIKVLAHNLPLGVILLVEGLAGMAWFGFVAARAGEVVRPRRLSRRGRAVR